TAILVFPEIYGDKINKIAPKNKKIIFNQNCYYTFNQYSTENNYYTTPYQDPNTLGTIVVSEDSFAYLNYTFPSLHIYKTSIGINHSIFNYSNKKQKQICFMPRKLAEDVAQVVLILKLRNKLNNWKFISIDNKTEAEVAKIMKESIFFLSFNHREGFGLPPVEAMACGCYVIGYHGEAGKEYLFPSFSSIIESGDILTFVQKIEEMINIYEKDPTIILEKGKQASDFVLSKYSMEREEKDILNNWNNILNLY
ncbi:MAG: glycosyltransferase, partial [Capnocytophaga sp.]|nr:glycosyltransferase [Capnocytophaga sp.]